MGVHGGGRCYYEARVLQAWRGGPLYKNIQEEHAFWLSFDPIPPSANTAIMASSLSSSVWQVEAMPKLASGGGGMDQFKQHLQAWGQVDKWQVEAVPKLARGGGGGMDQF
jgi:hypothetical protein